MFDTTSATEAPTEGAEYLGCTEPREHRRACFDDSCRPRATCKLWVERDAPGYAVKAMTWRTHYLCFTEPCSYHQPVEPAPC